LASGETMVVMLPERLASPLPFSAAHPGPPPTTMEGIEQPSTGLPFSPAPEASPPPFVPVSLAAPEASPPPFVLVPLATPPPDAPAPRKKRKKKRLKGLGGQFMAAVHDYERQGRGG
jgi:hypothetical protein